MRDLVGVSRALLLSALVIMAATYLTRTITYSRAVILIFWPVSALLVTAGRALGRRFTADCARASSTCRRAAIVGEDARRGGSQGAGCLRAAAVSTTSWVTSARWGGRRAPNLKPVLGERRRHRGPCQGAPASRSLCVRQAIVAGGDRRRGHCGQAGGGGGQGGLRGHRHPDTRLAARGDRRRAGGGVSAGQPVGGAGWRPSGRATSVLGLVAIVVLRGAVAVLVLVPGAFPSRTTRRLGRLLRNLALVSRRPAEPGRARRAGQRRARSSRE